MNKRKKIAIIGIICVVVIAASLTAVLALPKKVNIIYSINTGTGTPMFGFDRLIEVNMTITNAGYQSFAVIPSDFYAVVEGSYYGLAVVHQSIIDNFILVNGESRAISLNYEVPANSNVTMTYLFNSGCNIVWSQN